MVCHLADRYIFQLITGVNRALLNLLVYNSVRLSWDIYHKTSIALLFCRLTEYVIVIFFMKAEKFYLTLFFLDHDIQAYLHLRESKNVNAKT